MKILNYCDVSFEICDLFSLGSFFSFHKFDKLIIDRFPHKNKNVHDPIEHLGQFFLLFDVQMILILMIFFHRGLNDKLKTFNWDGRESVGEVLEKSGVVVAAFDDEGKGEFFEEVLETWVGDLSFVCFEELVAELPEIVEEFCMEGLDVFLDNRLEASDGILALIPSPGDVFQDNLLTIILQGQFNLINVHIILNNGALIKNDSTFLLILFLLKDVGFVPELVPVIFSIRWYFTDNILVDQLIKGLGEGLFEILFSGLYFEVEFLAAFELT